MPTGLPANSTIRFWGPAYPDGWCGSAGGFWSKNYPDRCLPDGVIESPAPAGAGVFQLVLESGSQVTYIWKTTFSKSRNGLERRAANLTYPQQTFSGNALFVGQPTVDLRARIARFAALGTPFLLGLPYEALTLTEDAVGATLTVGSTTTCDWCVVPQRVIVESVDEPLESMDAVLQAVTPTTMDTWPFAGTLGNSPGRVMPAVSVYLDAQQGFARYGNPDTVEYWTISARAAEPGPVAWGLGATLAMVGSSPLWDRNIIIDGTGEDSVQVMNEILDMGGVLSNTKGGLVPDWGRAILYRSSDPEEWQWVKKFLFTIKGRWKSFYLSSWRKDLLYVSHTANSVTINTAYGDVTSWWPLRDTLVLQHITGAGSYVKINNITDNGNGTTTLTLSNIDPLLPPLSLPVALIAMVSWLEKCRLENDSVEVQFDNSTFSVSLLARVVYQ